MPQTLHLHCSVGLALDNYQRVFLQEGHLDYYYQVGLEEVMVSLCVEYD